MTTLETIITLIFLPTSIVAGLVFILRKFFEQMLSRNIEHYKNQLKFESEQAKLRLEGDLQQKYFEFQTKFSYYYQKQMDVIGETYVLLNEAEWITEELLHPGRIPLNAPVDERVFEVDAKWVALSRFFNKNRFYLDEETGKNIDTILSKMRLALVTYRVSHMNVKGEPSLDMLLKAWNTFEKDLPPLKKALETQFRQSSSTFQKVPATITTSVAEENLS